jgi:hypothetical protein
MTSETCRGASHSLWRPRRDGVGWQIRPHRGISEASWTLYAGRPVIEGCIVNRKTACGVEQSWASRAGRGPADIDTKIVVPQGRSTTPVGRRATCLSRKAW